MITSIFPFTRPRRLRQNHQIRSLVRENTLSVDDLILPMFVIEGENISEDITTMPNVKRYSVDLLVAKAMELYELGIKAIALFPIVSDELKSELCEESYNEQNLICRTIRALKEKIPHMLVIADVALDPYNINGHDGLTVNGEILNDETIDILCKQALSCAKAGADILAPSDMMDGRIIAIREILEGNDFSHVAIVSYSAKYCSSFYGPFRDAVGSGSALKGDKKTYQMDPANAKEALREIALDIEESADAIIIKPGIAYLDIVSQAKENFNVPIFSYQVSGEYAMIKFASQHKAIDHDQAMLESLLAFKRAGADCILTYFAEDVAKILKEQK